MSQIDYDEIRLSFCFAGKGVLAACFCSYAAKRAKAAPELINPAGRGRYSAVCRYFPAQVKYLSFLRQSLNGYALSKSQGGRVPFSRDK